MTVSRQVFGITVDPQLFANPSLIYLMLAWAHQRGSSIRVKLRIELFSSTTLSFHLDFHAHPRVDAALKKMFTRRQICDLELAALQESSPGYGDLAKTAGAFRNSLLSRSIELRYEPATKMLYLGEGMRLAALIDYANGGSFCDVDCVRFEVPIRVGMS